MSHAPAFVVFVTSLSLAMMIVTGVQQGEKDGNEGEAERPHGYLQGLAKDPRMRQGGC